MGYKEDKCDTRIVQLEATSAAERSSCSCVGSIAIMLCTRMSKRQAGGYKIEAGQLRHRTASHSCKTVTCKSSIIWHKNHR